MGKLIAASHHEVIEGKPTIQLIDWVEQDVPEFYLTIQRLGVDQVILAVLLNGSHELIVQPDQSRIALLGEVKEPLFQLFMKPFDMDLAATAEHQALFPNAQELHGCHPQIELPSGHSRLQMILDL
jgi:hypothetical protein